MTNGRALIDEGAANLNGTNNEFGDLGVGSVVYL